MKNSNFSPYVLPIQLNSIIKIHKCRLTSSVVTSRQTFQDTLPGTPKLKLHQRQLSLKNQKKLSPFEMGLAFLQSATDKIKRVESSSELRQSRRLRIRVRRIVNKEDKEREIATVSTARSFQFNAQRSSNYPWGVPSILRGKRTGPTDESIQRGIVSNEIGLKNAIARKSNKASTIKSSTSHPRLARLDQQRLSFAHFFLSLLSSSLSLSLSLFF